MSPPLRARWFLGLVLLVCAATRAGGTEAAPGPSLIGIDHIPVVVGNLE